MKWAQFINNYQKSYTRKTNEEAVCLAVLFFYVLPRYTKQRQVKGSMFLINVLPDVYTCPLRKKN